MNGRETEGTEQRGFLSVSGDERGAAAKTWDTGQDTHANALLWQTPVEGEGRCQLKGGLASWRGGGTWGERKTISPTSSSKEEALKDQQMTLS